jgi:RNA polymerase II subunit A C-terminal domain phosphatase SSU72
MLAELLSNADAKAQEFYKRTKLIDILRRNKQIKRAPERWQDLEADVVADYDVVICFEQRIYDAVVEGTCGEE